MKNLLTKRVAVLASASVLVLLSACDSGGSSGNNGTNVLASNDFAFPSVSETNGSVEISSPEGPAPTFSARRTLESGSGNTIEFSDPVVLKYEMFSWSTGEKIESTDDFDEPMTVRAGVTEGVPEYLSHSLLGRKVGDKMQIVFEAGMEDLPEYLDDSDAYILIVELI